VSHAPSKIPVKLILLLLPLLQNMSRFLIANTKPFFGISMRALIMMHFIIGKTTTIV